MRYSCRIHSHARLSHARCESTCHMRIDAVASPHRGKPRQELEMLPKQATRSSYVRPRRGKGVWATRKTRRAGPVTAAMPALAGFEGGESLFSISSSSWSVHVRSSARTLLQPISTSLCANSKLGYTQYHRGDDSES